MTNWHQDPNPRWKPHSQADPQADFRPLGVPRSCANCSGCIEGYNQGDFDCSTLDIHLPDHLSRWVCNRWSAVRPPTARDIALKKLSSADRIALGIS